MIRNKQADRRKASILEALRSMSHGSICYATNKEIAIRAGYSPASLSIKQGLEELERGSIERYFETSGRRRFYVILDHPESGAVVAAIERGDPGAPRAVRYSTEESKKHRDEEEARAARNEWLVGLESCEDIYDARSRAGRYASHLSHTDGEGDGKRLGDELYDVGAFLEDRDLKLNFLNELFDHKILTEETYQSAWKFAEGAFVEGLRASGLDAWAEAQETGNWRLLARE